MSSHRVSLTVHKTPYSASETILFKFLPKDGSKITSTKLTQLKTRVSGESWDVVHPRNNVTVTMRHLMAKVRKNKEDFEVMQSKRRGPHPVEYWIKVK